MNHRSDTSHDSPETDSVWELISKAETVSPSPAFADGVVRAMKQLPAHQPIWARLFSPSPIAAFTATFAVVVLTLSYFSLQSPTDSSSPSEGAGDPFASIQDFAETQTLLVAADHLDDFSDQELASLIGF